MTLTLLLYFSVEQFFQATDKKRVARAVNALYHKAQKSEDIKRPLNFHIRVANSCYQDVSTNPIFAVSLITDTQYTTLADFKGK